MGKQQRRKKNNVTFAVRPNFENRQKYYNSDKKIIFNNLNIKKDQNK